MAKGSQRRSAQYDRDQSGCMSSLISIFDFRQGHFTRKLLLDRRRGSRNAVGARHSRRRHNLLTDSDEKRQDINDGHESKTLKVAHGKASVKKLMEEEMSIEHQPKKQFPSAAEEHILSDHKHRGHLEKKSKQTKETHKVSCDLHGQELKFSARLASQKSFPEEESSHNLELAAMVEEFFNHFHQSQDICLHHEKVRDSLDVQKNTGNGEHKHIHEPNIQLLQNHSFLPEKLSEATLAFLYQKFIDAKQLNRDEAIHESKHFVDALEILNSNKELFLKFMQEPQAEKDVTRKSLVGDKFPVEEIDDSRQNEEVVYDKHFQKHNMQNFFRRKVKSEDRNPSKGSDNSENSNRIVVLKPGLERRENSGTDSCSSSSPQSQYSLRNKDQSMRFASHFSLKEIKRKWKHAMRENKKDQHPIDGILHRTPYNHQDSGDIDKRVEGEIIGRDIPRKSHIHIERTVEPPNSTKRRDKIEKTNKCQPSIGQEVRSTGMVGHKNLNTATIGYPKQRDTNIYIEAKKHLSEMLSSGDEDGDFSNKPMPRTLGRILSLSPISSPGRDGEDSFVTAQMRFSPYDNFNMGREKIWRIRTDVSHLSPLRQSLETPTLNENNPNEKLQSCKSNSDMSNEILSDSKIQETISSIKEDSSTKGDGEIVEITEVFYPEKNTLLDVPCEPNSSSSVASTSKSDDISEICEEKRSPKCSRLKVEDAERIDDGPERPSPVSVLEPYFMEDIISPTSIISQLAETPIQPLRICFEEHDSSSMMASPSNREIHLRILTDDKNSTFEYVRTVIQASGLNWDEFLTKWPSSDQLLNPSLFDEVDILSGDLCHDRKLLFDCMNEVLVEIFASYFSCSPWVSFLGPSICLVPMGKNVILKVWEGIEWHLLSPPPPRSLEQIIGKDMSKAGTWMDLRFDTEDIAIEAGEEILDELMEEFIWELYT